MEIGNLLFGNSRGEFSVPRNHGWEDGFWRLFLAYAPDCSDTARSYGVEIDTPVFSVHPYYWGDCTCGTDDVHMPSCNFVLPNFLYKPMGFELRWYKYPLRSSYMNMDISLQQFNKIIDHCINSVTDSQSIKE